MTEEQEPRQELRTGQVADSAATEKAEVPSRKQHAPTRNDSPGKTRHERVAALFGSIRTITTTVVILLVVGVLGYEMWQHYRSASVTLEPISVPKALEVSGYTPEIVSRRLSAEIIKIRKATTTSYKHARDVLPRISEVDVQLPGAGVSFRSVLRFLLTEGNYHRRGD